VKATVPISKPPLQLQTPRVRDYMELFKLRISVLVLITTSVGYYLGSQGPLDLVRLLHTLLGTLLVSSASCALNQLLERESDARMPRTARRPLPAGRMRPGEVLALAVGTGLGGLIYLAAAVSVLCSAVALVTLLSYAFVYTPLKQRTPLAVLVGAVPGALPPMIGWAAARGELGGAGWLVFAILFVWQIPHFLAIAWVYRREYSCAGYAVLAARDPDGRRTGAQSVLWCLALVPVSILPSLQGFAGPIYLVGAIVLSVAYLQSSIVMARARTDAAARRLFFFSLLYLPLLLGLLVLDKVPT
jgi:heme o synthase